MTAIKEIVDLQNIDFKLQEIASLLGDLPLKVDALKDEEKSLTESLENGKKQTPNKKPIRPTFMWS